MSAIEYRNLQPEHYDDIIRVWTEAGLHVRPNGRDSRKHIQVEMQRNPHYLLGAFDGARLVGVVIGSYDGRRGCLNRLAVDSDYRHHGIAQELVRICEERLRADGAMIIYGLVESTNIPSQTLFKKMGYVHHDTIMYFSKRDSNEC